MLEPAVTAPKGVLPQLQRPASVADTVLTLPGIAPAAVAAEVGRDRVPDGLAAVAHSGPVQVTPGGGTVRPAGRPGRAAQEERGDRQPRPERGQLAAGGGRYRQR